MTKYIFIDSSEFVRCCVLETDAASDIQKALKTIIKKLDADEFKLLLPEIIELEFPKALRNRMRILKEEVDKHVKVKQNPKPGTFTDEMLEDINKIIDEFINKREINLEDSKKSIEKIFSHANTIKIPLEEKFMLDAYKLFIAGKKPANIIKGGGAIQSDCLIILSLKKQLENEKDYEIVICSANREDFAQSKDVSDSEIHEDIKEVFSNVKYYDNLLKMLNKEFGTKFSAEQIEKMGLEEQAPSNIQGEASVAVGAIVLSEEKAKKQVPKKAKLKKP